MEKTIRKFAIAAILIIFAASGIAAEQLTTVGVVDITRVYNSFFADSTAVRELENLKEEIQQELDGHVAILRRLQEQKLDAESDGDEDEALRLDEEIYEKQQYIQDFQRIKQRQLYDRQQRLLNSETFLSELQSAISFVAEANGFTVVVSSNDDKLLWWSQEVDITNLVLERLRATAR
ncbi:OmpH family outer membrane protein [Salinispira pacifica]|uniref:Outer membrane protein H n=1 Tax=Salinispira pacifica TaxID=1307761 RepID=V5WJ52_9SPIO|nr:OmpH family outer membrane protein [Salinispira pacifica]AHC15196.1 Outer membrane protein H precursor [Salinispira pacifica]